MSGERWRRPYVSESWRVVRGVAWFCLGAVGLVLGSVTIANATNVVGAVFAGAFFVVWQAVLWRVAFVGLYVADRGIKVRHVMVTRIVPWSRVHRASIGPATGYDAWAIWISTEEPSNGEPSVEIETPIWRKGTRARHRNRHQLDAASFNRLIDELNAEAARRRDLARPFARE